MARTTWPVSWVGKNGHDATEGKTRRSEISPIASALLDKQEWCRNRQPHDVRASLLQVKPQLDSIIGCPLTQRLDFKDFWTMFSDTIDVGRCSKRETKGRPQLGD